MAGQALSSSLLLHSCLLLAGMQPAATAKTEALLNLICQALAPAISCMIFSIMIYQDQPDSWLERLSP